MASHERLGNRRVVKLSNFPLIVTDQFYKLHTLSYYTLSYYTLSYYILSYYILFPTEYSFLLNTLSYSYFFLLIVTLSSVILFPTEYSFLLNTLSYFTRLHISQTLLYFIPLTTSHPSLQQTFFTTCFLQYCSIWHSLPYFLNIPWFSHGDIP